MNNAQLRFPLVHQARRRIGPRVFVFLHHHVGIDAAKSEGVNSGPSRVIRGTVNPRSGLAVDVKAAVVASEQFERAAAAFLADASTGERE